MHFVCSAICVVNDAYIGIDNFFYSDSRRVLDSPVIETVLASSLLSPDREDKFKINFAILTRCNE